MTDITDQDRRAARRWADDLSSHHILNENARAAVRYILATVDAPTLAEELVHITEHWETWATDTITEELTAATTRAERVERDLAETRAEVERLAADNEELRRTDNYREFREFLGVQKGAESNAENLDPADVPPGEAWLVEVNGKRLVALKDNNDLFPWNAIGDDGWLVHKRSKYVTLISRLVPAPRVITNPDELERLAEGAVILSVSTQYALQHGDDGDGWYGTATDRKATSSEALSGGPVTVLWEPEA